MRFLGGAQYLWALFDFYIIGPCATGLVAVSKCALQLMSCLFSAEELVNGNPSGNTN